MCVSLSSADSAIPATELTVMIFPERCCFITGAGGVARIDGPEQVHLGDELQEPQIEGGPGVNGLTTTAASTAVKPIQRNSPPPWFEIHPLDRQSHYIRRP